MGLDLFDGLLAVGSGNGLSDTQGGILPPVHFRHLVDARVAEPAGQSQADKELRFWVVLVQLAHGRLRQVVIVRVRNDDGVQLGDVGQRARRLGVPFGTDEAAWGTAVFKDRVEKHAQPVGVLDVVAGMAEPSGTQSIGVAALRLLFQEVRLDYCDLMIGNIRSRHLALESRPVGTC